MGLKAVIDLGSLKVKLSVFDKDNLELVFKSSYLVLLGKDIHETHEISEKAFKLLKEALREVKKEIEKLGVEEIHIIATEALRIAKNKSEVSKLVAKFFPNLEIEIIDQDREGELLFNVVSKCFPDQKIIAMDLGGGSIQVFSGKYDSKKDKAKIDKKFLYKTGVYKLQQKYSANPEVLTEEFHKAVEEVEKEFFNFDLKNEILIFGSTCMKDFIDASETTYYPDTKFMHHEMYTEIPHLEELLERIHKVPQIHRNQFYPAGGEFAWGADYMLLNLIHAAKLANAKYIYPTNLNSSYGLI